MKLENVISFFLPESVKHNKAHPKYHELYTVVGCILIGASALCLFPVLLSLFNMGQYLWLYYLNVGCHIITLTAIRYTGHYRLFNIMAAIIAYAIVYMWLKDSGLIFSINICIVHMFLLAGILADRKWGWTTIITNIIFLVFVYYKTTMTNTTDAMELLLGSPFHALLVHCLITVFLGSFLTSTLNNNELSRKKIIALRDYKIDILDEAVRQRTEQLDSMRQTIAADFHDQTGNMLAAINRQAGILQVRFKDDPTAAPLIESIITNSNGLYASSKDFLWNLNNDSDNPLTLFQYLNSYGQNFYNQFDIGFSSEVIGVEAQIRQLNPFAALNLIYIFKEAMNNIVKHSGATEVKMQMVYGINEVSYVITDNGSWKVADPDEVHYGLANMERRSVKSGFKYSLMHNDLGTSVVVSIPVNLSIS